SSESPTSFPVTHWTMVERAGLAEDETTQRQALVQLLTRYMPALKAHLVRRRGIELARADDLLQEFLLTKVLHGELIAEARRDKGRFRTFLLTVLDRFVISEQ